MTTTAGSLSFETTWGAIILTAIPQAHMKMIPSYSPKHFAVICFISSKGTAEPSQCFEKANLSQAMPIPAAILRDILFPFSVTDITAIFISEHSFL